MPHSRRLPLTQDRSASSVARKRRHLKPAPAIPPPDEGRGRRSTRATEDSNGSRRGKRRAYHHGDLKPALLRSAALLITSGGADALSVREVARRTGVTHAAVYRHFPDKAALVSAVATEGFERLGAQFELALPDERMNRRERFRTVAVTYVLFAHRAPFFFRAMYALGATAREAYPEMAAAARTVFRYLTTAVQRCQREGSVRPDAARGEVAMAALSAVHGLAQLVINGQARGTSSEAAVRRMALSVTQAIFAGLRA